MTFTEHTVNSSLGLVKLQGTNTGHITAKFKKTPWPEVTAIFNQSEAEALRVAITHVLDQIASAVIEDLEKAGGPTA